MKKFALIAATLICFAGCARNDTETSADAYDPGAADATASGTAGSSEIGQETGADNMSGTTSPSPGLDPVGAPASTNDLSNGASSLSNTNTNSLNSLPPEPMPPGAGIEPNSPLPQPLGNTNQENENNSSLDPQQQGQPPSQ